MRIAFYSFRAGAYNIFTIDVAGTNEMQLTNDPSSDFSPAFSPDGTKITFESDRNMGTFSHVWIMGVDGSNQTRLSTMDRYASYPVFN